jgi:L-ascorbate metabolism protein UlaG (beta-lactamase superfamily)
MTDLAVTRVGHSCHLIEIGGRTLLTDPWFTVKPTYDHGERVALTPAQLPPLDAIVISHEHYDHCDLDALTGLRDVPVIGPGTVAAVAREKGWKDVRELEAWEATEVGDVTVTAAPGKHGVHEVTFVLQGGGRTVFFGGDSLLVPEMAELPRRFGPFDLALLPTNGLCIRPLGGEQVVMNAAEAAELTAILRPRVAIPHHYAFTSGRLGDLLITKGSREPLEFAARVGPETEVRVVLPGQRVIPVSGS